MVSETLIEALRSGAVTTRDLEIIDAILQSEPSPVGLARFVVGGTSNYESVSSAMGSFELIASRDQNIGLKLMVGLYPLASDAFAHDVCNAIDLWIEHEGTAQLREYIRSLMCTGAMSEISEKLSSWAQSIAP